MVWATYIECIYSYTNVVCQCTVRFAVIFSQDLERDKWTNQKVDVSQFNFETVLGEPTLCSHSSLALMVASLSVHKYIQYLYVVQHFGLFAPPKVKQLCLM